MRPMLFLASIFLTACSSMPMTDMPSANQNSRINHLVLHFTSEHFAESRRLLTRRTQRPVSAHYLVPEPGDDTYPRERLVIHRLVDEERRAWHAGQSYWAGAESLNDSAIGIEIVNRSVCVDAAAGAESPVPETLNCTFLPFPEAQLQLVVALVQDIIARNPDIAPTDVIGHADIAPTRRSDPGPLFPWKRLYENGVGMWFDDETYAEYRRNFEFRIPPIADIQAALNLFGYRVEESGQLDAQTRFVLRALQMHFRPSDYTGQPDAETVAILYALNEKYRADQMTR